MSTHSAICELHGDAVRGRYVHSDGYPTWMGATLWALVQRDGVEVVRQTVIHDHYGWSHLKADYPELTPEVMAEAEALTPTECIVVPWGSLLAEAVHFATTAASRPSPATAWPTRTR